MAQSSAKSGRARFAAQAMRKPLRAMRRELAGVRRNEDIECVHRMRVASRRLRTALRLFGDELPAAARARWQKRLKKVTRALGAARDLDVQIAFLRTYQERPRASRAKDRPGIEHVRGLLTARRSAAQTGVCSALDRLESRQTLSELANWVRARLHADVARPTGADILRAEAGRAVRHRLSNLFAYEPYVERPDAVQELHAMRIAAKRLRYTLEAYAPLYADGLATQIAWGRQLQDWLGEIHDCDVWQVELLKLWDQVADRFAGGIEHLRQERAARRTAVYEEFRSAWRHAVATGYWDEFRQPFTGGRAGSRAAHGGRTPAELGADERLRPVLDLARSCRYEVEHTHQVTRLALRLFEQLAPLHGLGHEQRFWLTCASLLHDIGWIEGRAGHHKTALRLILDSPRLPWDDRLRRIVGLVARYHRKALPRREDEHLASLSVADRQAVLKLAAILRIADALDYSHASIVDEVTCRMTAKRISLRCAAARPADVECARASEKGDLAAQVFHREIRVTWHPR